MNPNKIKFDQILIARKLSLLEHDMRRLGLSKEEVLSRYKSAGIDWEKVLSAYGRQLQSFDKVMSVVKNAQVIEGRSLKRDFCKIGALVIILGGDNYFQYVSHFLDTQFVLGVNSDPERSEGVLTAFDDQSFAQVFEKVRNGQFILEEWSRLEVSLNGQKINSLAISEVYIGSWERFNISKYVLSFKGEEEEQKSSGVLIATGAGSTGWFRSATGGDNIFPKTAKEARFFVTEIFRGKHHLGKISKGVIKPGEKLEITSLGKHKNVVSIDSKLNHDFPRGSKVSIEFSDKQLKVIVA